jgi:hypothetical protein
MSQPRRLRTRSDPSLETMARKPSHFTRSPSAGRGETPGTRQHRFRKGAVRHRRRSAKPISDRLRTSRFAAASRYSRESARRSTDPPNGVCALCDVAAPPKGPVSEAKRPDASQWPNLGFGPNRRPDAIRRLAVGPVGSTDSGPMRGLCF